jgi:hypothetical protein
VRWTIEDLSVSDRFGLEARLDIHACVERVSNSRRALTFLALLNTIGARRTEDTRVHSTYVTSLNGG